jgi:glucokinase
MKEIRKKEVLYDSISMMINSFLATADDYPAPVCVVIGFAGPTMSSEGKVYCTPNIGGLSNLDIGDRLENLLGMPVFVENDTNCAALGEYRFGAGRGAESLFLFTIGTGVGGAFVVGGTLWEGFDGTAGEIGHTVIRADGPRCNCGKRGCLEAMVSATAIVREYERRARKRRPRDGIGISAKEVVDRARAGERAAAGVIREAAHALGIGIANVFGLLDPELILIGGGVSRAGSILIDPAVEHARSLVFGPLRRRLKVRRARLGDDGGLLGAACLGFQRISKQSRRHGS